MKRFISTWNRTSLIKRIAIGVVVGAVLGLLIPKFTVIGLLGDMFVGGLKAIAPLLVFALVANALSQTREGQQSNMKTVIVLYLFGTFAAALTAVISHCCNAKSLRHELYMCSDKGNDSIRVILTYDFSDIKSLLIFTFNFNIKKENLIACIRSDS